LDLLRDLFARSTTAERDFIIRLFAGELRQGALAGVMLDAIAAAANLPVALVRRAAMYAEHLGAVARAALIEGTSGLERFQLQLLSPIAPMLAQTAADVSDAFEQLDGEADFEWKMDGARIQVPKMAMRFTSIRALAMKLPPRFLRSSRPCGSSMRRR
jgi:ATP-dependent DNA ligase